MPTLTDIEFNRSDRDLLVELRTEMRGVRLDITEMKDDTKIRLTNLEADTAALKIWRGVLIGGWVVLTILVMPILVAYVGSGNVHITNN